MKAYWIGAIALVTLGGCGQGVERLEEKAKIEGQAGAVAAVQEENRNYSNRVDAMAADLERRHRLIEALEGLYEGTLVDAQGRKNPFRLMVSSSFPRQPRNDRFRSIEEVAYELNNLYLNAQVVEWTAEGGKLEIAFGCVFEQIRPNMVEGTVTLMSEGCKSSYAFAVMDATNGRNPSFSARDPLVSRRIALDVLEGKQDRVASLTGVKQSNIASTRFPISVTRR